MAKERIKYTTAPYKEIDTSLNRPNGTKFCPYCGNWKKFLVKSGHWSAYKRCQGCGISVEDFWYKMVNKEWGIPDKSKIKPKGRNK